MSEEIAKMITELRDAFHKHCEDEAKHTGRVDMLLENLCKSVDQLNKVIARGSNGKSIAERLTLMEAQVANVSSQVENLWEKIDGMQTRAIGFWTAWASIACAVIAAGSAVIVALIK